MTDRQRKSLMKYIAVLAKQMRLSEWDIFLRAEPCENVNHAATVSCVPGRNIANIQVSGDWFDMDPHTQRHVLVHELIHIHVDREFQLIEALSVMVGSAAFFLFETAFRDLHEHGVDAIASILAPHFPLPE